MEPGNTGKEKPLNGGMTVSDKVMKKWSERRQVKKELQLSISIVILSSPFISLFPFSPTLPSSVTHPISTLLLPNAPPLTPQWSLSFPAFSHCFIYSLLNSLQCICSPCLLPGLSLLTHLTSFSVSFTHSLLPLPPLFISVISSLLNLPHLSKMPLVLQRIYGQFISLGECSHFLYNSWNPIQAIPFAS